MRVALVTDKFNTGGGLEHLFQTVKALGDIEFSLFADGGDAGSRFSELPNVRVCNRGYSRANLLSASPDIIHFHHLRPMLRFFATPWPPSAVPLVATVHGLHVRKYDYLRTPMSGVRKALRCSLERMLFRKVDRVVAVSHEDRAFLETTYGLRNTICIANGVDVGRLNGDPSSKSEARRALSIPEDATVFLTVARFDFQKGYDVLMEAVSLGIQVFRGNGVRFVLVGAGEQFDAIRNLARKLGIIDCIHFLGEKTGVYALMKAGDLFVLPSRWEGLPYTLLEAFFCGLPIVASDTCGNRELVRNGVNGLLFENENPESLSMALTSLVRRNERERLSGGTLREEFRLLYDREVTARRIAALYRELRASHRA